MTIEEELYLALRPYCIELGWIKFDENTEKAKEITSKSEVIDWKVIDYEQESAIWYLSAEFPEIDKSIIHKVISDNLIHIDHGSEGNS